MTRVDNVQMTDSMVKASGNSDAAIHRRNFLKAGLSFGAAAAGLAFPGSGARAAGIKAHEYIQYDAMGLGELVNKGEVTADELLTTALEIARKVQPSIGALCNLHEEAARKRIKAGIPKGPFTGVPFVLKDIKAAADDIPMDLGSRFFANTKTPFDTEIVKRYRQGGLVIFGRSTTSELALYIGTEADAYGYDTANPWNLEYSPGGSSGGAAACVAAGVLPMAHATDGAGSIRLPAANCGLVGLKPTRALLPTGPIIGEMWGGMLSEGVVSRSVRDTAASLDITQGPDLGAPYYAPPVTGSFLDAIKRKPRKLKIAFMKDTFGGPASGEVAEAIEKTAGLCRDLGHEVVEDSPTELNRDLMWTSFFTVMVVSTAMSVEDKARVVGRAPSNGDLEEPTLRLIEMAKQLSPTDYVRAISSLQQISRKMAKFFAKYDMLLSPMGAEPAMPLRYFKNNPPNFAIEALRNKDYSSYALYEPFANMTGQPAASIPLFWGKNNMPIGSQFFARFGEDETLLQLAAQLEEANPWFNRLPDMTKTL